MQTCMCTIRKIWHKQMYTTITPCTPHRACAARGQVIALGLDWIYYSIIIPAKKIETKKNTHFQKSILTQEG